MIIVLPDNRKNNILIFDKGVPNRSDDTTLTAKAEYSINFSEQQNKFCLSLHYNRRNSFFVCQWSKNLSIQRKRF